MLTDPSKKYLPYTAVPFPPNYIRRWPNRRTTVAPTWLSTDLRDGNQALVNPMSNTTKLELFRELVKVGFKQIEVAYPSASEQEFQFVRSIIQNGEVPDDVSLQIITPARPDLIKRSIDSLAGTRHAIIHLYNAVSPIFREVVFRNTKEQTIELTLSAVKLVKKLTEEETARSGTRFTLNYCFETFSQTEIEFAVDLGNKVLDTWDKATPDDKVIFNLAATVECAPSNHYADMVEYFSAHINQRDCVTLSIHPHNDRGTAVAAAELGLLAGGDRIEGCLLGNGERTGNVDLITLALNMYSQGVSPGLDFSRLAETVALVCRCNEMSLPTRYPYAGQLVFSAFAGTHQDAIKKGLDAQAVRWADVDRSGEGIKYWAMPYIPLDPKDLGYGYENLIRVSSQSGKAGAAYVIKQTMMVDLPRQMQVAFHKIVQEESERTGKEMTAGLITSAFKQTYSLDSKPIGKLFLHSHHLNSSAPLSSELFPRLSDHSDDLRPSAPREDVLHFEGEVIVNGEQRTIRGDGHDLMSAVLEALRADLGLELTIHEFSTQIIDTNNSTHSKEAAFIKMSLRGEPPGKPGLADAWGIGISSQGATSMCRAIISAANQLVGTRELPLPINVIVSQPAHSTTSDSSWLRRAMSRTSRLLW